MDIGYFNQSTYMFHSQIQSFHVENRKRLSRGENCKHVNTSINTRLYGHKVSDMERMLHSILRIHIIFGIRLFLQIDYLQLANILPIAIQLIRYALLCFAAIIKYEYFGHRNSRTIHRKSTLIYVQRMELNFR